MGKVKSPKKNGHFKGTDAKNKRLKMGKVKSPRKNDHFKGTDANKNVH